MSKRQYGIMPPFPALVVMMRGSERRHFVYGINWLNSTVIIYRNGEYQITPIDYVKFVEPTEEELELIKMG
ncbi:hypothetical protein EX404_21835 [Salmonella enterica]|nr:hypothetical protein [Salmonella enterica]MDJ6543042.1 hypothetical protein [Salmonella enterica]MDJ7049458.1 hypothetical protein [Salmonella enterica]MDJ7338824.1 hypothetical protein [Salmonella enterica]